jgi:hypothetical protein
MTSLPVRSCWVRLPSTSLVTQSDRAFCRSIRKEPNCSSTAANRSSRTSAPRVCLRVKFCPNPRLSFSASLLWAWSAAGASGAGESRGGVKQMRLLLITKPQWLVCGRRVSGRPVKPDPRRENRRANWSSTQLSASMDELSLGAYADDAQMGNPGLYLVGPCKLCVVGTGLGDDCG